MLLLAIGALAHASGMEHQLTWDIQLDGTTVGSRTLTVKYLAAEEGTMRRILESYAEFDGEPAGQDVSFAHRVTGHAGKLPSSFHSVVSDNGTARDVQARVLEDAWRVSVSEEGFAKTFDLAPERIDLSTVDLLDPATTVPISRYESARVLSAETAEIWEGEVTRMGPSELVISGEKVHCEEYMWEPPQGRASFYYTADGFLVKYEMKLAGVDVMAILKEPPPEGVDDAPVPIAPGEIREVPL